MLPYQAPPSGNESEACKQSANRLQTMRPVPGRGDHPRTDHECGDAARCEQDRKPSSCRRHWRAGSCRFIDEQIRIGNDVAQQRWNKSGQQLQHKTPLCLD